MFTLPIYDLTSILGSGQDGGGVTLGDKTAKQVFNHWIFLRRPLDYFLQKTDIFEEQTGHRLLCLCKQTRPLGISCCVCGDRSRS